MTEQAAQLATAALVFVMIAPLAIPPLCRWRCVYGRQGLLSLTRRGALRTALYARREGYRRVYVERF